jgi:hypothetical protein
MGKKGSKSWIGSKCHVAETAEKGKVNFITDVIYQKAHEHDSRIHETFREDNDRRGLDPEKLYADSSYISGPSICEYRRHGQELMGYMKGVIKRKPEPFRMDRFTVDMEKLQAVCPAGHVSARSTIRKGGYFNIYFDRSTCMKCPFFSGCVGTNTKDKRRALLVSKYQEYIQERRAEQKTEEFIKEMSVRSQIEGTMSEATRFHGLRYAKYRGEAGHQLQFYLTASALNVKRLIKVLTKRRKKELVDG